MQNCSLLLKIAIDIVTFKYDYWFIMTGESLMRKQNTAHYAKCSKKSLLEAMKCTQLTERGQKRPSWGDGSVPVS